MTRQLKKINTLDYLKKFISHNKARGMIAEMEFETYVQENASAKVISGCWLISPSLEKFTYYRYAIFILPQLFSNNEELQVIIDQKEHDRGFQALATFLVRSGIGVIVSAAISEISLVNPEEMNWQNFIYENEKLKKTKDNYEPFNKWPKKRPGYARKVTEKYQIQSDLLNKLNSFNSKQLTSLALRQSFYYSYLKHQLKLPTKDPYDVDSFVVAYTGSVMPIEIKEKSPTDKGYFGIDAGRIIMMLRLCIATDSNALYIIREIDNTNDRNFVGWRFVTLSDMIMGCSWNLQAGGKGMGGGDTQTIMLPYSLFQSFELNKLSEEWLSQHSSLQNSVKIIAKKLSRDLSNYL